MSEQYGGNFVPNRFIQLEPQPNFPHEDVSSENAELLEYLIEDKPGIVAQSVFLREHQRVLHHVATVSMRRGGVVMETNPETYAAFTYGFSVLESVAMILKGRGIENSLAAKQFAKLYPSNPFVEEPTVLSQQIKMTALDEYLNPTLSEEQIFDDVPDAELRPNPIQEALREELDLQKQTKWVERYRAWPDLYPNTFSLVVRLSGVWGQGLRSVNAALLGAQTVAELSDPTVTV